MKHIDWYNLQKKFQGWDDIVPDNNLVKFLSDKKWCLDLTRCHESLQKKLQPYHVNKPKVDFFVTTDIELSKLPLEVLFKLFRTQYTASEIGGYIAVLSYYINCNTRYQNLTDSYKNNIDLIFKKNFSYVQTIENQSCVTEYPIYNIKNDKLIEGSNFIFVHPNIRYFLWK